MLVISRHVNERVRLELPDGRFVWVTVQQLGQYTVRLGFEAPKDVKIFRSELLTNQVATPLPATPERGPTC